MGQTPSFSNSSLETAAGSPNSSNNNNDNDQIRQLIAYARTHYQDNPTESLAALLQAVTLNSGTASANRAMDLLRQELGDDIADNIGCHHSRMERALQIVQELLTDESTYLYKQGREDLLRQTMQDGSSIVCSKCSAVVSSQRWQQHQLYWCQALPEKEEEKGGGGAEEDR